MKSLITLLTQISAGLQLRFGDRRARQIINVALGLIGLVLVIAITALSSTFARAEDKLEIGSTMLRPKAGGGLCLTINGSGATNQLAKCNPYDARQRIDIGLFGIDPPGPLPGPTPPASTPTPDPSPTPEDPKTKPAEVPACAAEVPLSMSTTSVTNSYQSKAIGPYRAVNNTWGVKNIPSGTWSQQIGIAACGSAVDFRIKWDFTKITCPKCDVISYPEVAYGRSASFEADPGAGLPKRISELQELITSYEGAEAGNQVRSSHLAYDLWTSNNPNVLARANRLAEIMLPEFPWNGYGVPNSPAAATVGRGGQVATGRNPKGYQGRETIGGAQYDVYFFPAGSPYTGLAWKFIVYAPVVYGGAGGAKRDWLPILRHGVSRGWLGANDWLNAVEFGVEPAYQGSAGEVTVRSYQVKAR